MTKKITTNLTEDYDVINIRFNCIVCIPYGILFYISFLPQNDLTVPRKTSQSDRVLKAGQAAINSRHKPDVDQNGNNE